MDKAIIFDVDGTLSETEETHRRAFNLAFGKAGLPWHWDAPLYAELLGVTGGKERIRHYIDHHEASGVPPGDIDEFVARLHRDKTAAYTSMVATGDVTLRPGIFRLIQDAQAQGFRLAIATTTTPANVDALLRATLGRSDMFEVICAGDSVPEKKPAPDVYLDALRKLGLRAADCVAIEDSRNGLLSACAAGIRTVVTPGMYTADQDFDAAALIVDDLDAIDFRAIYELTSPAG